MAISRTNCNEFDKMQSMSNQIQQGNLSMQFSNYSNVFMCNWHLSNARLDNQNNSHGEEDLSPQNDCKTGYVRRKAQNLNTLATCFKQDRQEMNPETCAEGEPSRDIFYRKPAPVCQLEYVHRKTQNVNKLSECLRTNCSDITSQVKSDGNDAAFETSNEQDDRIDFLRRQNAENYNKLADSYKAKEVRSPEYFYQLTNNDPASRYTGQDNCQTAYIQQKSHNVARLAACFESGRERINHSDSSHKPPSGGSSSKSVNKKINHSDTSYKPPTGGSSSKSVNISRESAITNATIGEMKTALRKISDLVKSESLKSNAESQNSLHTSKPLSRQETLQSISKPISRQETLQSSPASKTMSRRSSEFPIPTPNILDRQKSYTPTHQDDQGQPNMNYECDSEGDHLHKHNEIAKRNSLDIDTLRGKVNDLIGFIDESKFQSRPVSPNNIGDNQLLKNNNLDGLRHKVLSILALTNGDKEYEQHDIPKEIDDKKNSKNTVCLSPSSLNDIEALRNKLQEMTKLIETNAYQVGSAQSSNQFSKLKYGSNNEQVSNLECSKLKYGCNMDRVSNLPFRSKYRHLRTNNSNIQGLYFSSNCCKRLVPNACNESLVSHACNCNERLVPHICNERLGSNACSERLVTNACNERSDSSEMRSSLASNRLPYETCHSDCSWLRDRLENRCGCIRNCCGSTLKCYWLAGLIIIASIMLLGWLASPSSSRKAPLPEQATKQPTKQPEVQPEIVNDIKKDCDSSSASRVKRNDREIAKRTDRSKWFDCQKVLKIHHDMLKLNSESKNGQSFFCEKNLRWMSYTFNDEKC